MHKLLEVAALSSETAAIDCRRVLDKGARLPSLDDVIGRILVKSRVKPGTQPHSFVARVVYLGTFVIAATPDSELGSHSDHKTNLLG